MPFSEHAFDLLKRSRCFFDRCPYCHHNHIKKYGKEYGHHRWMPRHCGKMFSDRPGRYCTPQSSVLPRSAGSFPWSRTERLCDRQHTRHMSPCRLPCFGSGRCRECRKGKKKRGLPRKLLQVAVGIDSQGGVLLRLGSRGLAGTGDSMDAFLGHVAPGSIVYHDMGHFSGCFPGCTARTFRYGCRRMRSGRSRERVCPSAHTGPSSTERSSFPESPQKMGCLPT